MREFFEHEKARKLTLRAWQEQWCKSNVELRERKRQQEIEEQRKRELQQAEERKRQEERLRAEEEERKKMAAKESEFLLLIRKYKKDKIFKKLNR